MHQIEIILNDHYNGVLQKHRQPTTQKPATTNNRTTDLLTGLQLTHRQAFHRPIAADHQHTDWSSTDQSINVLGHHIYIINRLVVKGQYEL